MCGFAGYVGTSEINTVILQRMLNAIETRGPDDFGYWQDEINGVFLGHRRLSILDISENGKQPMHSRSGRYTLVFNGEIYNHQELRVSLSSYKFKGSSDTETLLACIEGYGLELALSKIHGMFAFAIWDNLENSVSLARDRFGEKPLYYGLQQKKLIFGSELKALKVHPDFQHQINREAIALQIRYGYVPAPLSIYENISKLEPGTHIKFSIKNGLVSEHKLPEIRRYWNFSDVVKQDKILNMSSKENVLSDLDSLLSGVVKNQMIADVPLGALLSGGIDSSLITALMQSNSNERIKTFSIGFEEKQFNEAEYAAEVARYLNTDHTELYISSKDALNLIPSLHEIYDEPFADSSQIPTFFSFSAGQEICDCRIDRRWRRRNFWGI